MVIIKGGRGSGKTVTLLKLSAQMRIPILCMGHIRPRILKETARKLGLDIPEPLIWSCRGQGRSDKRVLIDDAEQFFQMMLAMTYGAQAQIMTINAPVLDIDRIEEDFKDAKIVRIKTTDMDIHRYGQWESKEDI